MPEGGCHGTTEWITGYITDRCPVVYVDEYALAFKAHVWAKRGFLPFSGGWAEQPAKLMEQVSIIMHEVNEVELERSRSAQQQVQVLPAQSDQTDV